MAKVQKTKKKNVRLNLNFVAKKMKVKRKNLILMHQTHSNKVIEIKKNNCNKKIIADAMITKMRGTSLGVLTADCVPIILYDIKNNIIGCIHAGWKGAYLNIIKKTIFKMKKMRPKNKIYASIGPCIGKKIMRSIKNFLKNLLKNRIKTKNIFLTKAITKNFLI